MIHAVKFLGTGALVVVAALAIMWTAIAGSGPKQAAELPKDLKKYRHIGAIVVPDPDSPVAGFHHFYINDKGLKTFHGKVQGRAFPAGTVIVGKVFKTDKTEEGAFQEGQLAGYTVMVKDPEDDASKKTGGWHFAKLDAQGKAVKIDPVSACFKCHEPHAAQDFVISTPLR